MSGAEVLHIGCGAAPDIDPEAARVVLVEPNPDHVPVMRAQVREMGSRVRLIPAAVAEATGSAPFHICNFSDLSGLEVPAALFALMPGLKQVKTAEVQTLSVADLLRQARLRKEGYRLRCEAPGVVPQLLDQLLADGGLQRIATLWLTVGAEPFYGPGSDAESVIRLLQDHGYRLLAREDEADPDWPCLKFEQDRALLDLTRARDAARAVQATLEAERAALLARLEESDAARQAADARVAEMQADLAKERDRATALGTDRDRLQAELAETGKAHVEIQAQLTRSGSEITALQERVAALTQDRDTQRAAAETARADLGMALRMQAMAAADLKDLQDRHSALSASKDRQDAVLGQLALQLGDVSEHLQQIEAAPAKPRLERDPAAKKDRA